MGVRSYDFIGFSSWKRVVALESMLVVVIWRVTKDETYLLI